MQAISKLMQPIQVVKFYIVLLLFLILSSCSLVSYNSSTNLIKVIIAQEEAFFSNPVYISYIQQYELENCVILYNSSSLLVPQAIYYSKVKNYCILEDNIVVILQHLANNSGVLVSTVTNTKQLSLLHNYEFNNQKLLYEDNAYEDLFKNSPNFIKKILNPDELAAKPAVTGSIIINNINDPTNTYIKPTILRLAEPRIISPDSVIKKEKLLSFDNLITTLPENLIEDYLNLHKNIVLLAIRYNINYYEIK